MGIQTEMCSYSEQQPSRYNSAGVTIFVLSEGSRYERRDIFEIVKNKRRLENPAQRWLSSILWEKSDRRCIYLRTIYMCLHTYLINPS